MHELEGRADLELSIHLDKKVAQAAERLFAECGRERTQASFHSRSPRHYVPGSIAVDVADRRVALHPLVLESLDDGVQPLD